ncbi:MAG: hypothetical protein ACM34A_15975 [Bacillota bacterium]
MTARAVIVHRIAGRVRLRIDEKRGDAGYFSDISERFARFGNVYKTKANPVTGSLALEFSGDLDDLLRRAEQDGLLSVGADTGAEHSSGAAAVYRGLDGGPINLVSGRDINRDFMMGALLLLVGVGQMFRGKWFPPAFSVLWYARQAFNLADRRR